MAPWLLCTCRFAPLARSTAGGCPSLRCRPDGGAQHALSVSKRLGIVSRPFPLRHGAQAGDQQKTATQETRNKKQETRNKKQEINIRRGIKL